MKRSKEISKIWFILLGIILILGVIFGLKGYNKSRRDFAIIPHFMLDSGRVDQFYDFINNEYFSEKEPDTIILISPNHFYTNEKEVKTICKNSLVHYKSETTNLSSKLHKLGVKCDKESEIFYTRGDIHKTNEHGIGEHFQRINKHFPNSEVLPVISPCFQFSAIEDIVQKLENLNGNILVIASVDFAHYQNEEQTLQHDEKSIETLKSMTLNQSEFMDGINADCPVCLYLLQYLANKQGKKAELRYRDSSSTIMNQDMGEENTSRIFIWYK